MAKSPVADRMAMVEKRFGGTVGQDRPVGRTPSTKIKIKPKGNILRGKFGIEIKKEF
jgi:hypothetical protein